jgi:ubiquinone/menaquinone biosynthesis C-methylase UbiE
VNLSPEEIKTIKTYDDHYDAIYQQRNTDGYWKAEADELKKHLPSGKIIEFGCGGGRDVRMLLDLGYEYIGTDISKVAVEKCKAKFPNQEFISTDLYSLPFEDGSFDGFWTMVTLMHIYPRQKINLALAEIKRVLHPEAYGCLSIKNGEGETLHPDVLKQGGERPRMFTLWTEKQFADVLAKNGFEVLKSYGKTANSWSDWLVYFVKVR